MPLLAVRSDAARPLPSECRGSTKFGPEFDHLLAGVPISTNPGPNSAKIGRKWPSVAGIRPILAESPRAQGLARLRPTSINHGPASIKNHPESAKHGSNSTHLGTILTNCVCVCATQGGGMIIPLEGDFS